MQIDMFRICMKDGTLGAQHLLDCVAREGVEK